jgi:hypothetical protein
MREAQQSFRSLPFVLGDAHSLPYRTQAVDVVAFITTLEFLEGVAKALREAARVAPFTEMTLPIGSGPNTSCERRAVSDTAPGTPPDIGPNVRLTVRKRCLVPML